MTRQACSVLLNPSKCFTLIPPVRKVRRMRPQPSPLWTRIAAPASKIQECCSPSNVTLRLSLSSFPSFPSFPAWAIKAPTVTKIEAIGTSQSKSKRCSDAVKPFDAGVSTVKLSANLFSQVCPVVSNSTCDTEAQEHASWSSKGFPGFPVSPPKSAQPSASRRRRWSGPPPQYRSGSTYATVIACVKMLLPSRLVNPQLKYHKDTMRLTNILLKLSALRLERYPVIRLPGIANSCPGYSEWKVVKGARCCLKSAVTLADLLRLNISNLTSFSSHFLQSIIIVLFYISFIYLYISYCQWTTFRSRYTKVSREHASRFAALSPEVSHLSSIGQKTSHIWVELPPRQ